mgnify:CR=1 FL=1
MNTFDEKADSSFASNLQDARIMMFSSRRASELLVGHANVIIAIAAAFTAILVIPMSLLAPDERASTEPGGEVFDLRDEIDEKLRSSVFITAFLAEARDGDMLRQAPLYELLLNERALLKADSQTTLTPGARSSWSTSDSRLPRPPSDLMPPTSPPVLTHGPVF